MWSDVTICDHILVFLRSTYPHLLTMRMIYIVSCHACHWNFCSLRAQRSKKSSLMQEIEDVFPNAVGYKNLDCVIPMSKNIHILYSMYIIFFPPSVLFKRLVCASLFWRCRRWRKLCWMMTGRVNVLAVLSTARRDQKPFQITISPCLSCLIRTASSIADFVTWVLSADLLWLMRGFKHHGVNNSHGGMAQGFRRLVYSAGPG